MVPGGPAWLGVMVTLIVLVWPGPISSRPKVAPGFTEPSQKSPALEVTELSKLFVVAVMVMLLMVPPAGGEVKPPVAARAGTATQPPAVSVPLPPRTVAVAASDGAPENTSGSPRNG